MLWKKNQRKVKIKGSSKMKKSKLDQITETKQNNNKSLRGNNQIK